MSSGVFGEPLSQHTGPSPWRDDVGISDLGKCLDIEGEIHFESRPWWNILPPDRGHGQRKREWIFAAMHGFSCCSVRQELPQKLSMTLDYYPLLSTRYCSSCMHLFDTGASAPLTFRPAIVSLSPSGAADDEKKFLTTLDDVSTVVSCTMTETITIEPRHPSQSCLLRNRRILRMQLQAPATRKVVRSKQ